MLINHLLHIKKIFLWICVHVWSLISMVVVLMRSLDDKTCQRRHKKDFSSVLCYFTKAKASLWAATRGTSFVRDSWYSFFISIFVLGIPEAAFKSGKFLVWTVVFETTKFSYSFHRCFLACLFLLFVRGNTRAVV